MRLFNQRSPQPDESWRAVASYFQKASLGFLHRFFLTNKLVSLTRMMRRKAARNNHGSDPQKFCDNAKYSLGVGVTEPDLHDLMASVIADQPYCRNKKSAKLLSFC
jgi:hypothetical protein